MIINSTTFGKSKRFLIVVKYWLTRDMLNCERKSERPTRSKSDPFIQELTKLDYEYKRSGCGRGHQMDAYDRGCDSTIFTESFYYSNVAPQLSTLDRGV